MVLLLNKVHIHLFGLIRKLTEIFCLSIIAVPSPCQGTDGPQALTITNKGFIMCDGERLFVESCPGGTVWDDLNKACVWPDMQAPAPQLDQQQCLSITSSLCLYKIIFSFQLMANHMVKHVE